MSRMPHPSFSPKLSLLRSTLFLNSLSAQFMSSFRDQKAKKTPHCPLAEEKVRVERPFSFQLSFPDGSCSRTATALHWNVLSVRSCVVLCSTHCLYLLSAVCSSSASGENGWGGGHIAGPMTRLYSAHITWYTIPLGIVGLCVLGVT